MDLSWRWRRRGAARLEVCLELPVNCKSPGLLPIRRRAWPTPPDTVSAVPNPPGPDISAVQTLLQGFRGSGADVLGWRRIWVEIARERTSFRQAVAATLTWSILKVTTPVVFVGMLTTSDTVLHPALVYAGLGVVVACFTSFRRYLALRLSRKVERSLLLSVHANGLRAAQSGTSVSAVVPHVVDPGKTQLFVQLVPTVLANLLQVVVATAAMLVISPVLALATLVPILVGGLLYSRHSRAAAAPARAARSAHGRLLGLVDEHINGMDHLTGLGAGPGHADRFHGANLYAARAHLLLANLRARYMPLADIALSVATVSAVLVGGMRIINGSLVLDELLMLYMYATMLVWPVRNIGMFTAESLPACEAARRIAVLEDGETATPSPINTPTPRGWVSILVDPGDTASHFPGFAEVDGASPAVFAGTFTDNVSMGFREPADREVVENLCRSVGLDDEISQRPGGYLSDPGSSGVHISGGQRQRLSLARALAADHETLVLRSPLYAVDSAMTSEILERIRIMRAAGNTVLVTSDTEQVQPGDTVLDFRSPGGATSASVATHVALDASQDGASLPPLQVSIRHDIPADWRKLLAWLPPRPAVFLVLGVFAAGVLSPLLFALHRWAVDGGIVESRPRILLLAAAIQTAVILAAWWTTRAHTRLAGRLGEGLLFSLRGALFDGVRRSSAIRTGPGAGPILARATSDAEAVRSAVSGNFLPMFSYILLASGSLIVTAVLQGDFAPYALAWLPVMLPLSVVFRRRANIVYPAVARAAGDVMVAAHENLSGCSALRHHDPRSVRAALFTAKTDAHLKAQMQAVRLTGWYFAATEILGVLALSTAAYFWSTSASSPGALFALFGLLALVFEPLQNAVNSYGGVRPGVAALERLHQLTSITGPSGEVSRTSHDAPLTRPANGKESVYVLDKVSFSFGEGPASFPVFDDINLSVTPGERLALVGPSGSGKSTLLKLFAGTLTPSSGSLSFMGYPSVPLGTDVLWVPQDVEVFSGTVRYNLSLAPSSGSLEDSLELLGLSAEFAGVLERQVSELSFAQRKLLCFARAAVCRPPVLLLDEPTSGLADSQRGLVIDAIGRLGSSTTVVLATHSGSLMDACSRLVVLPGSRTDIKTKHP